MDKYQIRTDLATEAIKDSGLVEEEKEINGLILKRIIVKDEDKRKVSIKPGMYYTLDTRSIQTHDTDDINNCIDVLSKVIKEIMEYEKIEESYSGLIVGLGNINVTPDSLGPLVVDNVIVTRHMFLINPEKVSEGIREISAIAPGVMGTTGIETFDVIDSLVKKIKFDYIIVVDALSSRAIDRVNKTIQVTNTGISPGSGVGNKRKELSKDTIGIPVIAIGVPTVVDAVTIANDTIDIIMKYMHSLSNNKEITNDIMKENINKMPLPNEDYRSELFGNVGLLDTMDKRKLIDEILTPMGFNMIVTPKEVDLDISDLTEVISKAIDKAVHPIVNWYEN